MRNQSSIVEEAERKLTRESVYVKITNSTEEKLIVYGPKRETEAGDYKNSWYTLHPGQTTPSWWECDGLFVPKDRSFKQVMGDIVQGPLGVKYNKLKSVTITQNGDQYLEDGEPNDGVFRESEINWSIPDFSSKDCQEMILARYQIPD